MATPNPLDRPDAQRRWRQRSSFAVKGLDTLLCHDTSDEENKFFVPSYLNRSIYMQRLEDEHKAKLRAKQPKRAAANSINNSTPDITPGPLPPGSHRGLSHTIVERSPSHEDHDDLTPLPSGWNKDDMWTGIEMDPGNIVKYTVPKNHLERDYEASAVRANHYIPPQCGIYYYEVTILDSRKDDTTIAVGFSTKTATLSRPIGWEPESWGYHGDDGRCFTAHNVGKHYGPQFNKGDVVGCGINFKDNTAFFTRNGLHLGTAFHQVDRDRLFPAISLRRAGERIKANFGQEPFVFDIDRLAKEHRAKILHDISITNTSQLDPGMTETELIQALVLQFLQHDGYVDTARAFAGEMRAQKETLNQDPEEIGGISIKDDEDANNRQRIRSAVLEGDIDKALKYTQAFYPKMLPTHDRVHFKLRCRKFIEMVRRAAELSMASEPTAKSNGLAADSNSQKMDLDQNGAEMDNGENHAELVELEQDLLLYGQTLQADYAKDPRGEFTSGLQEIWALMAYKNPLKEPQVKHLLDQQGRAVVAEELNSAILSSLGKSSRAALEKVYAQTSVLLDELRRDGGEGAFISVDDYIDEIPNHDAA